MMNYYLNYTRDELLRESIIVLKKKCKSLKISAEGSKSDVIQRIMARSRRFSNIQLSDNTEQQYIQNAMILRAKRRIYLQQRKMENKPCPYQKNRKQNKKRGKKKSYILNKLNCGLLVTGYIRRLDKLINKIIPNDIVILCLSSYFNNVFQVLPPYRLQNEFCCVDQEDRIFTTPGTESGTGTFAIFKTPWWFGIHELKFECIHDGGSPVSIGIVTNVNANCKGWLFDRSESHLSYQLFSSRQCYQNGVYCYEDGDKISYESMGREMVSDGVIMSIIVDFNKWTIKYYLNEIQVGNTMEIARNKKYYPAIAYKTDKKAKYKDLKYRLLSCV